MSRIVLNEFCPLIDWKTLSWMCKGLTAEENANKR